MRGKPCLELVPLVDSVDRAAGKRFELVIDPAFRRFGHAERAIEELAVEMQAAVIDGGIELPQRLLL